MRQSSSARRRQQRTTGFCRLDDFLTSQEVIASSNYGSFVLSSLWLKEGFEIGGLVLVGGCSREDRDYALQVRREANGYPIDILINADLASLNEELRRAAIYWHATGFGVDLQAHPERAEHFGISPIEAMSAGAIPLVFDVGGPREIIESGISGFTFKTEEELIARTHELIALPSSERRHYSTAAVQRSAQFSSDVFRRELLDHVDHVLGKN